MSEEDYAVVRAMEFFGGGFVQALAAACHRADAQNLARIKAAFPELWAEYRDVAELHAKRPNVTA